MKWMDTNQRRLHFFHGSFTATLFQQEVYHEIKKSSTRDKTEGMWHKVKGKIKQIGGKAVGNRELKTEGKAENIDGKVQEKIGQIKDVGGK